MLIPVADGVAVIACSTCRGPTDHDGHRGGAMLATALRRIAQTDPAYNAVMVHEMPCLFACADACTVHLRAPGKIGYVLGRFAADNPTAQAILDYACAYAASECGEVPYGDWPEGVKGHFITRTPPGGFIVA